MGSNSWRQALAYHLRAVRDFRQNRGRARGDQRLLFVRHPLHGRNYYGSFLRWVAQEHPDIHAACEVRSLPFSLRNLDRYGMAMSWVGDSQLTPGSWELRAMQKLNEALSNQHVPLVNSLSSTLNSAKHSGALTMSAAGVRTPQSRVLEDPLAFAHNPGEFPFPLLIRENYGHAGTNPMLLVESPEQLRRADLSRYRQPIAVEFVDVREPGGHCRRYRYIAAGEVGLAFNLHVSADWEVRGQNRVTNDQTHADEQAFIAQPCAHHTELQRARRALGLDLVGFDYSYDHAGQLVVWEANSLPSIGYAKQAGREFLKVNSLAMFAALLRMLLEQANWPIPQSLDDRLAATPAVSMPGLATDRAETLPQVA